MEFIEKNIENIEKILRTGKTPPSKNKDYYNGEINWYTPGDLDLEKNLGKSKRTVSQKAFLDKKLNIIPEKSIMIGCIGDVGKLGIASANSSSNQQITALVPKPELDIDYLFYYLKANKTRLRALASNAILPMLNNNLLRKFKVKYPKSLTDQKRIAKVLSACETLISKRKESIELLDEFLKSTFLEMFGDRKGRKASFDDLIDIQSGLVDPNELPYSEMFHVGGRNIKSNTGELSNLKQAKDENLISGKYLFEKGHLLYSKIRPNLNKVSIMNFTGICSADVYPIKPRDPKELNLYFLKYELQSQRFLKYAINNSGRANIPKINRKALLSYNFILPDPIKQKKFGEISLKTEKIKAKYQISLEELEQLYGSISQQAFAGELKFKKGFDIKKFKLIIVGASGNEEYKENTPEIESFGEKRMEGKFELQDKLVNIEQIIKNNFSNDLFDVDDIIELIEEKAISISKEDVKEKLRLYLKEGKIKSVLDKTLLTLKFQWNNEIK